LRKVLDPELLDFIDALVGESYNDIAWRVTWANRDPIAGNSGGGRWSPDGSFEALYMSLEQNGAIAEVYHHLSRAPVFSSSHVLINQLKLSLNNVLRLDMEQLRLLGIEDPLASRIDYDRSQSIGETAHMLDYEGLIVPSARWECMNLVLFLDRIDLNTQLAVITATDINWPAWREQLDD